MIFPKNSKLEDHDIAEPAKITKLDHMVKPKNQADLTLEILYTPHSIIRRVPLSRPC